MSEKAPVVQEEVDAARMRQILAHLPYFAVMIDRDRRFVWVNRLDATLSLDQVIGRRIDDFQHPSSLPNAIASVERAFTTSETVSYESRAYGEGDMETWYGTTIVPLPPNDRGEERALLLSIDVTERHAAETALRESEHRFRMVTEATPDFIAIVNRDRRITYLNRDAAEPPGMTAHEAEGLPITDFTHVDDRDRALAVIDRTLEHGEPGTYEARSLSGERSFEVRVTPLSEEGQPPQALVTARDVTDARHDAEERAELEAHLQRAQRLEAVGQLAGGVAHDFNNLLMVIQSRLEVAMIAVKEGKDPIPDLQAIDTAVERASDMTHRLLTIGQRQARAPTTFDLAAFGQETMRLLDRMVPESITMTFHALERDCLVHADRAELQQVLINLCLNARDAIDDVGTISVTVAPADPRPGDSRGGWLALRVTDTGSGMDEETRQRAFEPFFTTKTGGRGSGLGLAMVHGIVAANGGVIDLETEPGAGTTVTVLLPRVYDVPPESRRPATGTPHPSTKSGKILVAEDDAAVRSAVVKILEASGYDIIEAANGREAVELFLEHRETINLVLLDAVMPVLGGKDAYDEIARIDPNVRALFSSGYATETLSQNVVETRRLRVLPKPYRASTLLAAIHDALT